MGGGSLKLSLRVLARRKFFTFVSLFGTTFTLAILLVVAAFIDEQTAPKPPELNLRRTLDVSYLVMKGPESEWSGNPGYRLLHKEMADLPGVEAMAIASGRHSVASYVRGARVLSELRATNGAYWRVLSFRVLEGGVLGDDDDAAARPVAVISEAARARLLGSGAAVGRTIELDGRRYTVKGVVANVSIARDVAYADVWVPIGCLPGDGWRDKLMGDFSGIILARSRADFPAIRAEFARRLGAIQFPDPKEYDRIAGAPRTRLERIAADMLNSSDPRPPMRTFVLLVAAATLLFMALPAVNLVNVNCSRIGERAGEIGVRKAFGASVGDLVGQFVAENVVLCLIGGALGLAAAHAVLVVINGSALVPNATFAVSWRLAGCAVVLSLVFGVLSGAWPAWRMARLHPVEALRGGTL